jgi:hypothetical protein
VIAHFQGEWNRSTVKRDLQELRNDWHRAKGAETVLCAAMNPLLNGKIVCW